MIGIPAVFFVVMPGLDPGIHQIEELLSSDGLPGQARQ
jgi:hypothetical protein